MPLTGRKNEPGMRSLPMLTKIWSVLLVAGAVTAQAPQSSGPMLPASRLESFYVVVLDGSDSFRIVDFRPAKGGGSLVRLMDVHRACGTYHVKSNDYFFKDMSIQELAGQADLCGPEESLIRQVRAAKKKDGDIAPHQYAIAAECGSQTVLHHLPWSTELKFYIIEGRARRFAALWTLPNTIPFNRAQSLAPAADPAQAKLERHHFAEQAAIDIRGGNFDLAESDLPADWQAQGNLKLSDFVPEVAEATAPDDDFGIVENLDALGVENYKDIQFPPVLKIMNVWSGDVSLEVAIDSATGAVTKVTAQSQQLILKENTIDAAKQWVFHHPYTGINPLPVKIRFEAHCPLRVETTMQKKPKKRTRN
jgi:hypothetical protein